MYAKPSGKKEIIQAELNFVALVAQNYLNTWLQDGAFKQYKASSESNGHIAHALHSPSEWEQGMWEPSCECMDTVNVQVCQVEYLALAKLCSYIHEHQRAGNPRWNKQFLRVFPNFSWEKKKYSGKNVYISTPVIKDFILISSTSWAATRSKLLHWTGWNYSHIGM